MGSLEDLERRIARIEDGEAIKRLKARYAQASDTDYDWRTFGTLFTDDGVWESNAFGTYHGREAVTGFMKNVADTGMIKFAHHSMIPQWIDVAEDGQTAHGRWYLIEFATMPDAAGSDRAVIITCIYEDDFRKVDGQWLFTKVGADFQFVTDWDKGWVEQQFRG